MSSETFRKGGRPYKEEFSYILHPHIFHTLAHLDQSVWFASPWVRFLTSQHMQYKYASFSFPMLSSTKALLEERWKEAWSLPWWGLKIKRMIQENKLRSKTISLFQNKCGRTNLNYTGSSTRVHSRGLRRASNGIIPWPVG
jgi:hypothetical protein